jgi:hypothetical protein
MIGTLQFETGPDLHRPEEGGNVLSIRLAINCGTSSSIYSDQEGRSDVHRNAMVAAVNKNISQVEARR